MTRALANGRHFPATGPGWQTRINDALRRAAIAARWGPEWVLVSLGDKEAYGSWSPCEMCGSARFGPRFPCVAWRASRTIA